MFFGGTPDTYHTAGIKRGTATSTSTRPGTTSMTGAQDAGGGWSRQLTHKLAAGECPAPSSAPTSPRIIGAPGSLTVWPRVASRPTRRGPRNLRDAGVTVLRVRLKVRGGGPAPTQARQVAPAADARRDQRDGVRGLRRLQHEKQLPFGNIPVGTPICGRDPESSQNSCNTDYSCLDGECPSFITFTVRDAGTETKKKLRKMPAPPQVPELQANGATGTVNVFLCRYRWHRDRHREPSAGHCGPSRRHAGPGA